jgi:hypothetical protein
MVRKTMTAYFVPFLNNGANEVWMPLGNLAHDEEGGFDPVSI